VKGAGKMVDLYRKAYLDWQDKSFKPKIVKRRNWFWIDITAFILFIAFLFCCAKAFGAEVGTASYYTVASCLREGTSGVMANGERLNDESLVCASWFYPFGTTLRITNVHNGKNVIVTVKDRGPAKRLVKKGRIIDLSKMAFSRIAKLTDGVVAVSVEVVK
jgi:rare lipoprotein A